MTKDKIEKIILSCSISENELAKINNWLIPSLNKQEGVEEIELYLVNYTGGGKIYNGEGVIGKVKISELNAGKQLGFGEAHNYFFAKVDPKDFFVIINPDVYLDRDCLYNLAKTFNSEEKIGILDARQLPYEHPKEFDEKTLETPWASGFLSLISSDFFKKSGGFDEKFWMYCEDVDLSWRAWLSGFKVLHQDESIANHYTGFFEYSNTRYYMEHFWSARNFLYISRKYFGFLGAIRSRIFLWGSGYPKKFINEVERSYKDLLKSESDYINDFRKKNRGKIKQCEKIKITGFNRYHNIRK